MSAKKKKRPVVSVEFRFVLPEGVTVKDVRYEARRCVSSLILNSTPVGYCDANLARLPRVEEVGER